MSVRNDFLCEVCGHHAEYWATRATAPSHCGRTMTWAPTRPPAVDAKEPFHQFDVEVNGRVHHVGSLHQMRQIERQAEQQARNGEGQPHIWRDYSQDRSNRDVHSLSKTPHKPMDGYARSDLAGGKVPESQHRTDLKPRPEKFKKRVGAAVTKDHGTV